MTYKTNKSKDTFQHFDKEQTAHEVRRMKKQRLLKQQAKELEQEMKPDDNIKTYVRKHSIS